MRLSDRTIEAVRERARIVDLFTDGELKRSGREFLARCPWHDDRHPSLTVSPRTNRAYCFVCARGVDSIGWLQDRQGLTFSDAVQQLADRYNVPVEAADAANADQLMQERAERARLFAVREQQMAAFTAALPGSPALPYLLGRGLNADTISTWGLGWNGRRVMVPLHDPQGRVIAFTGRVLDGSKPKYKNSAGDLLYDKGRHVFGLHLARDAVVRTGHVVVMEGQLDVISCWQVGIRNAVAASGSTLTAGMVEQLMRSTRASRITLVFDGDLAGRKAADRARLELQQLALRGELDLRILALPDGKDPADLAAADGKLAAAIEQAPHWVAWWLEGGLSELDLASPHGIAQAERLIGEIMRLLPDGALREYVRSACRQRLNSMPLIAPAKITTDRQVDACRWAERRALRLYLLDPGCRPALTGLHYADPISHKALALIEAIEAMAPDQPEVTLHAFGRAIEHADMATQAELMPLCHPIPEVRRVIEANPLGELQAALKVLSSPPCQPSAANC